MYKCVISLQIVSADPEHEITASEWLVEDGGNLLVYGKSDQHIFTDTLIYAPHQGIYDTVLSVQVMASTLPGHFIPALSNRVDGAWYAGPYKRSFIQAFRRYEFSGFSSLKL